MEPRTWSDGVRTAEIRRGTAADAPLLEPYFARVREAAPWFPIPRGDGSLERWLARGGYLDFERNLHWVALDGDRLAGHLLFQRLDIPTIGLVGVAAGHLSVDPGYRDGGLGAALMALWNPESTDILRQQGVRRIVAHIFPENAPSRRLAERVGLRYEGVLRRHMLGGDGRFHDMIVLGQLLTDEEHCEGCRRYLETADAPLTGGVTA